MLTVLTSIAVDRGFEPLSGQTKDYNIGICCFNTKHTVLRRKSKHCSTRIRIMCASGAICLPTRGQLLQWASTITIQPNVLIQNKVDIFGCLIFKCRMGYKMKDILTHN